MCTPRKARQGCREMELDQKTLLGQGLMAQERETSFWAKNRSRSPEGWAGTGKAVGASRALTERFLLRFRDFALCNLLLGTYFLLHIPQIILEYAF